ncbi:MAG: cobaltochelatase subunit CobN, partial [Candidatus Tectomicrobia bacterium]|nr:cobaltochelatase subunit CobN [Candidatus Tectomicrobia bacterium]
MILYLTTADTELLTLSGALRQLPSGFCAVKAKNVNELSSPEVVDEFIRTTASQAQVIILRLLGGKRAFELGLEKLEALCRTNRIALIACPGDQQLDPELTAACTAPLSVSNEVFEYLLQGGVQNFRHLLLFLSDTFLKTSYGYQPPQQLPWDGIYHP